MNQNHEIDFDCSEPLAEAVRTVVKAPLDDAAIERVRAAARELADDRTSLPLQPMPQAAARLSGGTSRFRRLAVGICLILLAGVGAWQLLGPSTYRSMLYAQVREATKKAGTIHIVSEVTSPDGSVVRGGEVWFSRGVGFACSMGEVTRIDDGTHLWEFAKGTKFCSRSRSAGPDVMLEHELDVKAELDRHCRRFPDGDREIEGKSCRCYQVVIPPSPAGVVEPNRGPEREVFVYVSEDFLVRRVETHEMSGAKWQVRWVRTWEYDVAVPPAVFRPDFGTDVKIVDADEAFNRLVDVQTAVHVTERDGLIYAVHRAEKFENGNVLLMTSVRGTEDTLRKFPPQRRMIQPGLFFVDGPATNWNASPQGIGCFRIILASADYQGINAQWWIVVPRGQPAGALEVEPGKIKVNFGVTPGGKFADQHKDANGVIHHITWDEIIAVSGKEPPATLAEIAERVYGEQTLLRAVKFKQLDLGVRDVNGVPTGKLGTIDDTRPADFAAAVAEHIKYWERGDVDFQITQGGSGDFDPATKQLKLIPGAFLSYYTLVDDETLKRVAMRTEVQSIAVRGTRIASSGLVHLTPLESLKDLDLAETAVGDDGLEHLAAIKSLRRLNVTGTRVTAAGIAKLKAANPDLEVIGE